MKILVIIVLVVFGVGSAFSQGAFDTNCYFPSIGNGIDTIYGSRNMQALGRDLRNIGPKSPGGPNQLVMGGLPPQIPFLSTIEDGAGFDIRSLRQSSPKRTFGIELRANDHVKFGHFRDTKHRDMLVGKGSPVIYWADENGDYDSSRSTVLLGSIKGDRGGGVGDILTPFYTAYLTSDTVLDIVNTIYVNWSVASGKPDSVLLGLWRGGHTLYDQGKIAYQDSVLFLDTLGGKNIFWHFTYQGDYRGVGREDLICVDDSNNWLYFKNDPPFSMQKFYDAIRYDTLLSAYENRPYGYYVSRNVAGNILHNHRVMAKPDWDRSEDIIVRIPTAEPESANKIFFFQGGADFGSKRLTLPTVTDIIYSPYKYSPTFFKDRVWGYNIHVLGDLTGTGNPVLYTTGGTGVYYVLGRAFDDKIDMFYYFDTYNIGVSVGGIDSINVNNDGYTDVLMSSPTMLTQKDFDREWRDVGTIRLLKGSPNIPVRLNPKYAVAERKQLEKVQMYAYPNPCEQKTVLTFENCSAGVLELQVFNSLGVVVQREEVVDVAGLQQYAVDMSSLSAGMYHIRLVCPSDGWSATTNIIKQAASQTPWKLDLRKIMGR